MGNLDDECRPNIDLTFDSNRPIVQIDGLFDNRQPQTRAGIADCILTAIERIEDVRKFFLWNANAVIADAQHERAVAARDIEFDRSAVR